MAGIHHQHPTTRLDLGHPLLEPGDRDAGVPSLGQLAVAGQEPQAAAQGRIEGQGAVAGQVQKERVLSL